jgi:Rrf2 family protein
MTAFKVESGIFEYVPTREISEMLSIPLPTAVKILQSLNRANLIETKEGMRGGVRLSKRPQDITLLDVFYAIEADRPLFRVELPPGLNGEIATKAGRNVVQALQQSEQAMKEHLRSVCISDLYK